MKMMSSLLAVRNADAYQRHAARPAATPASHVPATTCSRGGSARNAFGSRHGSSGSAQLSSDGVGTRDDTL